MRKQQSLHLAIPIPCHEDWDKMTPNERGRHCAMCNKTVVDFSLYTDRELVEFFKKATGNVCGRAHNYQLNREIVVSDPVQRSFLHKLFWGTAIASWFGFGATTANAQSNTTPVIQQNDSVKKDSGKATNENTGALKVHITDEVTKHPLPYANVVLEQKGEQITGGVTDIDGYAVIKSLIPGEYTVKAVYEGYREQERAGITVSPELTRYLEIPMPSLVKGLPPEKITIERVGPIANNWTGGTVTKEDIKHNDTKDIKSIFWDSIPFISKKAINPASPGQLTVHLTDKKSKEDLVFANVVIEQNGVQVSAGVTDIDGIAIIKPLDPGDYELKAFCVGYDDTKTQIHISTEKTTYCNMAMKDNIKSLISVGAMVITDPSHYTTDQATYSRDDIKRRP